MILIFAGLIVTAGIIWKKIAHQKSSRKAHESCFLKVMLSFALCHLWLASSPASAEIPNHHIFYRQDKRAPLTKIEIVFLGAGKNQAAAFSDWACSTQSQH